MHDRGSMQVRPFAILVSFLAPLILSPVQSEAVGTPPGAVKPAEGGAEATDRAESIPPWSEMRTVIESTLDAGFAPRQERLLSRSDLTPIFDACASGAGPSRTAKRSSPKHSPKAISSFNNYERPRGPV